MPFTRIINEGPRLRTKEKKKSILKFHAQIASFHIIFRSTDQGPV